MNPKINYELRVIMCQCRFILHKKYAILVTDVDNGGGYACVGVEDIGKIFVPSFQLCCKPNTVLKNSLKKKMHF